MKTWFRQLKKFWLEPMLQVGMPKKWVDTFFRVWLYTRTRMLSFLLSPLSIITVNFSVHSMVLTVLSQCGAKACVTMRVVLDLLQENFCAMLESGNIVFTRSLKLSATRKAQLCSATQLANSLSISYFVDAGSTAKHR